MHLEHTFLLGHKKTSIFTSLIGMDGIDWDGMVIIGQSSSKSTFGANKQKLVKLLAIKYAYYIQGRKIIIHAIYLDEEIKSSWP